MAKVTNEKNEVKRLMEIYKGLPQKQLAISQGLIIQAARIRVNLDKLSEDIEQNGLTDWFQQSDKVEPYKKARPEADLFVKLDKNYQSIIRQLNEMIQNDVEPDNELDEFRKQ